MTLSSNRSGRDAEDLAARRLTAAGMEILDRNWRVSTDGFRGELDIVARDAGTVVICEVKSRRAGVSVADALVAVTPDKQRRLRRLAIAWLASRDVRGAPVRFDVVGVSWPPDDRAPDVVHLRAAF